MIGQATQTQRVQAVQKAFTDVRVGDKVRIINSAGDIFAGTVTGASLIQGRFMLDVDVITLIRGGYRRNKWQQKVKRFANCPQYQVWVLDSGQKPTVATNSGNQQFTDPRVRARAQRAAYVNYANVFGSRREAYEEPEVVLGIVKGASTEVVKAAFRRLALKTHPDKGGDYKEFDRVCKAYKALIENR